MPRVETGSSNLIGPIPGWIEGQRAYGLENDAFQCFETRVYVTVVCCHSEGLTERKY